MKPGDHKQIVISEEEYMQYMKTQWTIEVWDCFNYRIFFIDYFWTHSEPVGGNLYSSWGIKESRSFGGTLAAIVLMCVDC